MVERGRGV
jgi:glucose repression mediator protein